MNCKTINKILSETSYVRLSGTEEEKKCAEYIKSFCCNLNIDAKLEPFPVVMYDEKFAKLVVDGKEIPCKGYLGVLNGSVKAKLYYLQNVDDVSLKKCKGKIVLSDKPVGYNLYDKLIEYGAKGFITYNGNRAFNDKDIEQREMWFETASEGYIPGVNVHVSDAFDIVKSDGKLAEIEIEQSAYTGQSYNVIADIKGETDDMIVVSAHYDTTSLSVGAYDNMSSCIGLLHLAEYFSKSRPKRTIRLLWCGSEERGLWGSIEYCRTQKEQASRTVLNINLDMLGAVMGRFVAFSCANQEMTDFIQSFLKKHRFGGEVRYGIRSSDSNSFVHFGIPAVSFARYAPSDIAPVHTRYDTAQCVSAKQLLKDMKIITLFTDFFANADEFSVSMEISEKIKEDVSNYMSRRLSAK